MKLFIQPYPQMAYGWACRMFTCRHSRAKEQWRGVKKDDWLSEMVGNPYVGLVICESIIIIIIIIINLLLYRLYLYMTVQNIYILWYTFTYFITFKANVVFIRLKAKEVKDQESKNRMFYYNELKVIEF